MFRTVVHIGVLIFTKSRKREKKKIRKVKPEIGYHPLKERLDALGLVGVVPQTKFFPRSWKQKLAPSADQLVQENTCIAIQLQFVSMFT